MKIHQLITLLALCLVLSLALQDVTGKKKYKQPINNSEIKNGQLATIQLKVNSLSDSLPLCSGLMIAPHLVLARANCLIILSTGAAYAHQLHKQKHVIPPMIHPSLLTISVNSTEKKVKLVEFHEHFNLFTLDHNMALILLQSNEEDANKILNRELQQVMEDMEKRGVENLILGKDNVKVLLPNLEIIESGECSLSDSNPSMNCRQISVSGEDEFSFEDSFLFQKSNQKDEWFPIGIATFHENQPRQARVYFSPINKQTLKWFHKVSKKLNEKVEKESFEGQTYHFSPVPNDKRFEIMAEMRHRLRQIINPDEEPTPQSNVLRAATTPTTFNSAYSHNLYETENNLKEISRQLHSKLVNTIMGKQEEL